MNFLSNNCGNTLFLLLLMLILPFAVAAPERMVSDDISPLAPSYAGVYVFDIDNNEPILARNADRLYIPASVTKALTSAAVMSLRDSNERFFTPVTISGRINGKLLEGNVTVHCQGDPTLGSAHIKSGSLPDSVAVALRRLGVETVKGRVMVTIDNFVDQQVPDGWVSGDLIHPYGAQHRGDTYADNVVNLTLPSGKTSPATPGLRVERSGKGGLSRSRNSDAITVGAKLKGTHRVTNQAPGSTIKAAVETALESRGIAVLNQEVAKDMGATIYTHRSQRYVDILRSLMVRSDNLFAEGMLRTLAQGDTRQEAINEEIDFWDDNRIPHGIIVVEDGSGLSRNNRLTPKFLAQVLTYMARSSTGKSYTRLFPRVGREGTVRNFLKGTPLEGQLALKTGSMSGVQAYAGYRFDPDDGHPTHAIVVLVNNFPCSRPTLKSNIGKMLLALFAPESYNDEITGDEPED